MKGICDNYTGENIKDILIYCDFSTNYFGYNKKIDSKWYTGNTGMEPVDNFIKMGFETGYLHHIIRLMIMGNYMNLYGLDPKDGFKWFMEFSCDSYEWVMCQNVLDMVFFVTGGKTMRKPYISSSNYIIKMSNYKKRILINGIKCIENLWKINLMFMEI